MADERLEFRIEAEGAEEAAKEIEKVGKAADRLDQSESVVDVEASGVAQVQRDLADTIQLSEELGVKKIKPTVDMTDRATPIIESVEQRLAGLGEKDLAVAIKAEAGQFRREISDAQRRLRELDLSDAEVEVEVANINRARADLTRIEDKVRDLDGRRASVKVDADTREFESGIDEVDGRLAALRAAAANPVTLLGGGGAAGFALGQQFATAAQEVETISTLLGASVEDASRLRAAMASVGIEANDLQDVVLQAAGVLADTPELAEELGVTLGRSPLENFRKVAAATEAIQDPMRRAVVQAKLFGEEGVRQVARVTAEFGSLENAIAEVDAGQVLTDEDIEAAKEFRAVVRDLTNEARKFANVLGREVVDNVAVLSEAVETLKGTLNVLPGNATQFGTALKSAISTAVPGLSLATNLLDGIKDGLGLAEDAADDLSEAWRDNESASLGAERAQRRVLDQLLRSNPQLEEQSELLRRSPDDWDAVGRAVERAEANYLALEAAVEKYRGSTKRAYDEQRRLNDAIREGNDAVFASIDAGLALADAQDRVTDAFERSHEANVRLIAGEGTRSDFEETLRDQQRAILAAAVAAGRLAEQNGADPAGIAAAQIAELERIRSSPFVGGQAGFINDTIARIATATAAPGAQAAAQLAAVQGIGGLAGLKGTVAASRPTVIVMVGGADARANLAAATEYAYRNGGVVAV